MADITFDTTDTGGIYDDTQIGTEGDVRYDANHTEKSTEYISDEFSLADQHGSVGLARNEDTDHTLINKMQKISNTDVTSSPSKSCKDDPLSDVQNGQSTKLSQESKALPISSNGECNTFKPVQPKWDTLEYTQMHGLEGEIQCSEATPLLSKIEDESKSFVVKEFTQSKFRRNCASALIITSLILSGVNIGIHTSILGPALPDLALLTNSTIPEMSILLAGNGAAFILGSVVAGILLEFMDGFFVVAAGFLLQGLALVVAFTFTDLLTLASLYTVAQFFATLGMAGISILCFAFPRRQAQILVQIVFMMLSVGKTVAPFIVTPFITPDVIANVTMHTIKGAPVWVNVININVHVTHISKAYLIIAMFSVFLSILNLAVFFVRGEKCIDWTRKTFYKQNKTVAMVNLSNKRRVAMLLLMAVMMSLESGMESTEMGLLTSYFAEYLHLGKQTGVNAAAFYQGLKIFFSLLVLLVLKFIHPATLLFVDLVCILAGSLGMTVAVWMGSGIEALWVTVAFISAGFSNYLATQVSWLEIRQPIQGKLAPLFSLALGLGGLSLPPLTTKMLTEFGPLAYPLVFTSVTIIVILLFVVTKIVIKESVCPSTKNLYLEPSDINDIIVTADDFSEPPDKTDENGELS